MITPKEANRLRGLIRWALECAEENAWAGSQDPHTAMHVRQEFKLATDNMWLELRKLTEDKK